MEGTNLSGESRTLSIRISFYVTSPLTSFGVGFYRIIVNILASFLNLGKMFSIAVFLYTLGANGFFLVSIRLSERRMSVLGDSQLINRSCSVTDALPQVRSVAGPIGFSSKRTGRSDHHPCPTIAKGAISLSRCVGPDRVHGMARAGLMDVRLLLESGDECFRFRIGRNRQSDAKMGYGNALVW